MSAVNPSMKAALNERADRYECFARWETSKLKPGLHALRKLFNDEIDDAPACTSTAQRRAAGWEETNPSAWPRPLTVRGVPLKNKVAASVEIFLRIDRDASSSSCSIKFRTVSSEEDPIA